MSFHNLQAPQRRILPALAAGVILIIFGVLSLLDIQILGHVFDFSWVPLWIICIWPRHANEVASIFFIFVAGILTDWATGGVTGQWALVFVSTYALARPDREEDPYLIINMLVRWLKISIIAGMILTLSGWFVFRVRPDLSALFVHWGTATLLFPIIFVFHRMGQRWLRDPDEWDF